LSYRFEAEGRADGRKDAPRQPVGAVFPEKPEAIFDVRLRSGDETGSSEKNKNNNKVALTAFLN
jgi:hypothetical protein